MTITLRSVIDSDLAILFEQRRDPDANSMAAFGAADPDDRAAFDAHWRRIRPDPEIVVRTIDADGEVAGSIVRWRDKALDAPEVSYWIGREFWGRGIATEALRQFLTLLPDSRLYGRVASTNVGSVRVLEKCGFEVVRVDRGVEATNGQLVDEVVLALDRSP
jgi:RimJ/RimL family protein N-acetyltransferase